MTIFDRYPMYQWLFEPKMSGNPHAQRNRSVMLKPRKHNKYAPHQGAQEKARRIRQGLAGATWGRK